MTQCNFPGREDHNLTKTYWQVPGLGDICDPCHNDWLRERERQAAVAKSCNVIAIHDANPNNLAGIEHVLWAEKECGCKDCLRAAAIIEGALIELSGKPPPAPPKPHPSRASRFEFKVLCRRPSCENRARYDSGYCGVCDLTENDGRGERLDPITLPEHFDPVDVVFHPDYETCLFCGRS